MTSLFSQIFLKIGDNIESVILNDFILNSKILQIIF